MEWTKERMGCGGAPHKILYRVSCCCEEGSVTLAGVCNKFCGAVVDRPSDVVGETENALIGGHRQRERGSVWDDVRRNRIIIFSLLK